jgi:N-acylneuraminate cytidylyltransferase
MKNIRDFKGKPMMQWPIEAARASGLFDDVIVSTDSCHVGKIALSLGCSVSWRKTDDGSIGTQEVAARVLDDRKAYQACVIYPCSPFLTSEILQQSHFRWENELTPYMVSVQADPLADAGCFYWCHVGSLRARLPLHFTRTMTYALPPERCIDINTEEDWQRAESMYDALRRAP